MWPDLLGPGWIWGVLMAACLFGVFLALVWLCGDFEMRRDAADPVQAIWRQYEQGELTRQEFERAKRASTSSRYSGEVIHR